MQANKTKIKVLKKASVKVTILCNSSENHVVSLRLLSVSQIHELTLWTPKWLTACFYQKVADHDLSLKLFKTILLCINYHHDNKCVLNSGLWLVRSCRLLYYNSRPDSSAADIVTAHSQGRVWWTYHINSWINGCNRSCGGILYANVKWKEYKTIKQSKEPLRNHFVARVRGTFAKMHGVN